MEFGGKKIWWFLAVIAGILLAIAVIAIRLFSGGEDMSLPPEQRVARNVKNAFNPEQSTIARLDSLRRALNGIQELEKDKRHAVIIETMTAAVNQTLQDFAGLPPEKKEARARLLEEDARRTLDYFSKLPPEKRRKALALLMSEESGRAQFDKSIDTITHVLSPQDREMLGPTLKIWKTMLEMK